MITIIDDVEYWYNDRYNYIYRIHKDRSNGCYRSDASGITNVDKPYVDQFHRLNDESFHKLKKISQQEANRICKEWWNNSK